MAGEGRSPGLPGMNGLGDGVLLIEVPLSLTKLSLLVEVAAERLPKLLLLHNVFVNKRDTAPRNTEGGRQRASFQGPMPSDSLLPSSWASGMQCNNHGPSILPPCPFPAGLGELGQAGTRWLLYKRACMRQAGTAIGQRRIGMIAMLIPNREVTLGGSVPSGAPVRSAGPAGVLGRGRPGGGDARGSA